MSYLEDHYNEIFKKYSTEELLEDIRNYQLGGGKLTKVLNHFFEEEMFKCCGKKTSVSPMDCLQDDEMMDKILAYVKSKPKFFTATSEVANVKSCLRNSMSWVRKVANFPPKEARRIYNYYNPEGRRLNCLDTSAGFGSRMSGALLSGNNYCGFDPNRTLFKQLVAYRKFLSENDVIEPSRRCGLYNHGSEIHRPELDGLFDVSFTSPPYFNLEKYSDDDSESTKNYNNYQAWVDYFVIPTVTNTYMYLKVGGYAMINIKNINKSNPCYDDFFKAFSSIDGFEFVEELDMSFNKKQYGKQYNDEKGVIKNSEPIMVFRKVK